MTADLDPATERALAAQLFNQVWAMLDKADRTPADDEWMVHAAHASTLHWTAVGTAQQVAIGEWQVSRVYAVLGRAEPAVHHAERCAAITAEAELPDWMTASAYEGLARAYRLAGDRPRAAGYRADALRVLATVPAGEDRDIVEQDLADLADLAELADQ